MLEMFDDLAGDEKIFLGALAVFLIGLGAYNKGYQHGQTGAVSAFQWASMMPQQQPQQPQQRAQLALPGAGVRPDGVEDLGDVYEVTDELGFL